ncbi:MAG: GNAT family N-acetyltransferase [Clostridia bacterium]|nr:GNAT family N-acetyltransferase [Clostridia bacterium]
MMPQNMSTQDKEAVQQQFWRVRPAAAADEDAVADMYREAIALLASAGVDQWQDGYPNAESFRRDLARGESYLLEIGSGQEWTPAGTMYLSFAGEPTYAEIEGSWGSAEPYGAIHRVALSPLFRGQNLVSAFFIYAADSAEARGVDVLRIDTHEENHRMQSTLARSGFTKRGVIWLNGADHSPKFKRFAYDADLAALRRHIQNKPPLRLQWSAGEETKEEV